MADPVIALAMVGRSAVSFEVLKAWIGTLRLHHWPGPTFLLPEIYATGHWTGVAPLRNLTTYRALQDPSWDYLLWIDADHIVHPGLRERVLELAAEELPNVGGLYFARNYPFEVQAFGVRSDTGQVNYITPLVMVPALEGGSIPRSALPNRGVDAFHQPARGLPLLRVVGCGTGCMLTRRDVLERLSAANGAPDVWRVGRVPWEEALPLLEGGENISGVLTEDVLFCQDIREKLGEETWLDLDPRMETGHQGEERRDRRHYLAAHQIPPGVDPASLNLPPGYEVVAAASTGNTGEHERPTVVRESAVDNEHRTNRERERNRRLSRN